MKNYNETDVELHPAEKELLGRILAKTKVKDILAEVFETLDRPVLTSTLFKLEPELKNYSMHQVVAALKDLVEKEIVVKISSANRNFYLSATSQYNAIRLEDTVLDSDQDE